ncbi:DMT family transporter [Alphaproteobacteria bacterium KMM 3653]|uniref:DMT family transporter n=1 Tax=Harenicola maris TaxID=2841044 RepID=A0AAP2G709_9RHOB|nr:DMT family transporter [Harenicola maris]
MSPQATLTPRATAELLLLGLLWGGTFLSVRLALDEVSVMAAVTHRVGWAALLLWGVVLWRGMPLPRGWRIWGVFAVMGLLNNVLPFSLMTWGQLYIETGLTSILNASTAIFGVLVAALCLADERLTGRKALGVLLGFAGVIAVIGPKVLQNFDPRSAAQLAVLGGTLSYAFAGVWARRFMQGLPPVMAAAGMLTCSALMIGAATLLREGEIALPATLTGAAATGYFAVCATALAYLLYYRILAVAGSGNTMLVTLVIPPVAIVLGALVLNEALAPTAYLGFALLAAGLLVLDGRVLPRRFR